MSRPICGAGALAFALSVAPCMAESEPEKATARADPAKPATAEAETGVKVPLATAVDPKVAKAVIEAAVTYLETFKDQGLGGAAQHLHPDAMEQFKTMVMPALDDEQERGTRALLNATFGRDAGFMDARLAPPAEVLSRFARVVSVRQPELAPSFDTIDAIGVLPEREHMHGVLRLKTGAGPGVVGRIEVVSLSRDAGTWKVLLDGRLAAVAQSLVGRDRRQRDRPLMAPLPEGDPMPPAEPQSPIGRPEAPAAPR